MASFPYTSSCIVISSIIYSTALQKLKQISCCSVTLYSIPSLNKGTGEYRTFWYSGFLCEKLNVLPVYIILWYAILRCTVYLIYMDGK